MEGQDSNLIISILKIVTWPITAFFALVLIKRPIINILNKYTKIDIGIKGVKLSQANSELQEQRNLEHNANLDEIDNAIKLYDPATILHFEGVIENETSLSQTNDGEKLDLLYNYSIALVSLLVFERMYNSILGSQLRLLQYINSYDMSTMDSLKGFYNESINLGSFTESSYPYDEYLKYLFNATFITTQGDNIVITVLGRDFIKFIVELRKPLYKQS